MVGDANHYFNRKLVENIYSNYNDIEIDFFTIIRPQKKLLSPPYRSIYDGSVDRKKAPYIFKFKGLFGLYSYYTFARRLHAVIRKNNYDFIHLQSAFFWVNYILKKKAFKRLKLIVTIWGSDFYRASSYKLKKMKPIFDRAEVITFASNKISKDFDDKFQTINKHKIVRFGLDAFNKIDIKRSKFISRESKFVVTVGYNRHPAQQHLKVLEALDSLDKNTKSKLKIVLPFTYGPIDNKYSFKIESSLKSIGIEYEILNEFMDEDEVATQCLRSNIMIQVQTTDAFSGSMLEFMYADNIIITGSWLPYDDLLKAGVFFRRVDKLQDIKKEINLLINNYQHYSSLCEMNRNALYLMSSWESNLSKWEELYM